MLKAHTVYRKPLNLRVIGLTLWTTAVAMQWAWWLQVQDMIPMVLVIVGGIIGTNVFLRRNILSRYPISASMVLGFSTYYFLLPPIATLIEGMPLTNILDHPILVFVHAFVCFLFLMGAHLIYRNSYLLQNLRWFLSDRVYKPFGFFRAPSNLHLLAMGSIGVMAIYLQVFVGGGRLLGADNKFMQGLFVLAYLPFVMLIRKAMGDNTGISPKWLLTIVGYTILFVMLSMARNSRAFILQGLSSIGLVYIYGLLIGLFRTRIISVKNITLAVVGIAILLGPIADISTSIVIVRGERTEISAMELVLRTLETFGDKEAIRDRRLAALDPALVWDEPYVNNQYMERLANLKYADNSIVLALAMNASDRITFRGIELQRSLSAFPRPVIRALGLPVDKDFVGSSSGGDLLLYTVTGKRNVLGIFRTGSIFGSGYALFGWGYPLVLAIFALFLFALADSLTSRTATARPVQNRTPWSPIFSPMAIIGFFAWFSYFTSAARGVETFSGLIHYILRGWLEVFFVYALVYWVTLFFIKPYSKL